MSAPNPPESYPINLESRTSPLTGEPIELSAGQPIRCVARLEDLVEPPALPACRLLYERNIMTISASANRKNTEEAYIDIDYATLSEENKEIARAIGMPFDRNSMSGRTPEEIKQNPDRIKLAVPLTRDDTSETVEARLLQLAEQLRPQKLLWAPVYTLDEIKVVYGYEPEETVGPESFTAEGYYYDPESETFHLSEELFKKSKFEPNT